MTARRALWLGTVLLYGLFWWWYMPHGGPLTAAEVDGYAARLAANGADARRIADVRRFLAADDGRPFVMINVLDLADAPPDLPATGPDADAQALMDHYMEHMYRALFSRACHPVLVGTAVHGVLDLKGIDGDRAWTQGAGMRYRSRRDMIEISSAPAFRDRHAYKLGALDATIAFPVAPTLNPGDLRLLLGLLLLLLVSTADRLLAARARRAAPGPG